jgi:hypothetical protein
VTSLPALEDVIDRSGAAAQTETLPPAGARPRQLAVRTLLAGMCLAAADHRPARLTRVHQALTSLPEDDQRRLGVTADWKGGPHVLTCRQAGYTFGLVAGAPGKDEPDRLPSARLQHTCDGLLEASVPRTPARRWPWTGRTWSPSPGPRRTAPAAAPAPGHRGDTAGTTCCAARTSCSSAATCRPRS